MKQSGEQNDKWSNSPLYQLWQIWSVKVAIKSEDVCFQYFAQQFLNVQDFKLTNNKKENKTEVATTKYMDYTSGLCVSNKHNKLYRLEGRLSVKCVYKSMYVDLFVKSVI